MFRKNPTHADNAVAAAVEPLADAATNPATLSYQAVASAMGPAVFPTERFRSETKERMLREFSRPRTDARPDAGSLDGTDGLSTCNVVRVDTALSSIVMADMESITPELAAAAAETIEQIVARHDERARLS